MKTIFTKCKHNPYIGYLFKVHNTLYQIHKQESISLFYLYLDYSWCLIRYGCLINQYYSGNFYKMPRIIRKKAFTQRRLSRIIDKYNDSCYIKYLKDKNLFNTYFSEFVHRRFLYSETMTFDDFESLYNSSEELFIKPIDDMEGHGIRKIQTKLSTSKESFNSLIGHKVLIEECIQQHPSMNLGNSSVNSVRILTALDIHGHAHILRAGLRAGVGDAVVDNFTAGGVLYQIDINTGRIDNKGIQGTNYNIIFHPSTDICMLGFQMPNWQTAIDSVIRAAEKLPQCRFIGWDVAFTTKGIELIEGNHNPGIFTMESLGTPGAYADVMKIFNN